MLRAKVIRKKRAKYPAAFRRINAQFLESAGKLVTGSAKANAPVDQGQLRDSITYRVDGDQVKIGTNVAHAMAIEYGREPGGGVNPEELKGWARRVVGDENAAYPIAKSIQRKGTKAQPYMRPALDSNRRKLIRLYEQIIRRVFGGR